MLLVVAVKALSKVTLVLVALGAVAGCGGRPLKVRDDGGASAGQSGNAGQGGATAGQGGGGGSAPTCSGLDEATCTAMPGCTAQRCKACPSAAPTYVGCTTPGTLLECPAESCVEPTCGSLDETSCMGRSDCHAGYCADCSGTQKFAGCGGPSDAVACPVYACPNIPACSGLDETSCAATPGCSAQSCSTCGGTPVYSACYATGNTPPGCLQEPCVSPPASCAELPDQATCDARPDCHSVFGKCLGCSCPTAGCGVGFVTCADGAKADCSGPKGVGAAFCHAVSPDCASTTATAYVVSYTADCYEGCVRPSECGDLGIQ